MDNSRLTKSGPGQMPANAGGSKTFHIWIEPLKEHEGQITAAATVERTSGQREELWYRVSAEYGSAVTSSSDPFVIGAVFLMMEDAATAGEHVRVMVHGEVSPSLIRNLGEFQLAWSIWRPEVYGRAEIRAEDEREANQGPSDENGVMCFSGGLDSAFTAYRHSTQELMPFPRRLRAGVIVQGMEFDLSETEIFLDAEERARRMLESLELPLIRIATNYREIVSRWPYSHGAAVASCLSLLQRKFNLGLIAQTMTYRNDHLVTEGVNPTSDWLFSSDSMRFVPDGSGFERLEKMDSLRDWPEFLENLRVCWQGREQKADNCCRCEKCIQTILHLRVLGLGLPNSFPHDVSDDQIMSMFFLSEVHMAMAYDNILREARERQISDSWVRSLEKTIRRNRRRMKMSALPRWRRPHYILWHKAREMLTRP